MLIPITREKFEQLIPAIATASQYGYYWGKPRDFLRRLLISVVSVIVIWILGLILGSAFRGLEVIVGFIAALYWLWSPVYWASIRNRSYRRYPYSGFLRGEVFDIFVTDEVISEEETVNNRGELVIVENRERRINVEVGDETGFATFIQAPLERIHKSIRPGDMAEMLVISSERDLNRISKTSEAYFPRHNLWVGEYPCTDRDAFLQVSEDLSRRYDRNPRPSTAIRPTRRRRR
ncbi:MAG: phosphate ABC transporter permease [Jaaginema sp. PMC 1080.18]|nr:phosphate ABC transporter permease [Jaaginema sp. PMC 1080.18]MEC4868116.1 phosphate ABC transporter permease [Jaaginema sp. PMC 1078.18]